MASLDYLRNKATKLQAEKASLQEKVASENQRILRINREIDRIQRSISKHTSTSSLNSKRKQISSKSAQVQRIQKKIADFEKQLSRKMDDIAKNLKALQQSEAAEEIRRHQTALNHEKQITREKKKQSDLQTRTFKQIDPRTSIPHSAMSVPTRDAQEKAAVALIMKGGGVKGIAFAGAIQVLEEHFDFHTCVGTSAGGLAAILVGAKFSGKQLEDALANLDFFKFTDRNFISGAWSLFFRGGWHSGNYCKAWINSMLSRDEVTSKVIADPEIKPKKKGTVFPLKEFPRRVMLFATSENAREPVICFDTKGERANTCATTAARCSMSIPFFFEPKKTLDDMKVMDGGLRCNFPVLEYRNRTDRTSDFIGLYLDDSEPKPLPKALSIVGWALGGNEGLAGSIKACFTTVLNQEEERILETHKSSIIKIDHNPITTVDFGLNSSAKELLILRGKLAALKWLKVHQSELVDAELIHERINSIETDIIKVLPSVSRSKKSTSTFLIILASVLFAVLAFWIFREKPEPDGAVLEVQNTASPRTQITMTPDPTPFRVPEEAP